MVFMGDLFVNICILITTLFIYSQLLKKREFISPASSFNGKITFGIFMGLVGVLLMLYTIDLKNGSFIDLRNLVVPIAALYGGILPTIIAELIVTIGRIALFQINISTLIASSNLLLLSIGCLLISRHKLSIWKKFTYMNLWHLILMFITFAVLLKDRMLMDVYREYTISLIIGGYASMYLMEYLRHSNELFKRVHSEATKDFLTGLNNVRKFDLALNEYIQRADERYETLSFLLLDIDHFKKVNDTYGHQAGDAVLKQLSKIISDTCRSIDFVSRNGGEEFSVILPACSKKQAIEVSERIRSAVENHEFILQDGSIIHVTVSIGLSAYLETTTDRHELIKKADDGLYLAKRSGRNQVSCSDGNCLLCHHKHQV